MGEARAQPSTARAAAGVFASEQPVRRAGRAWRLGPWRAFLLRLSRTAEVGVCGSVPAATATAAPPGFSDVRGELQLQALALGEEEGQGLVLGCELATQEVHFYSFETLSSHMLAPIKHQFWESSTQVCIHIESDGITNQLTYFGLISVSIPWIWSEVNTDQPNLVQWTSPNVFPSLTRL